MVHQHHVHGYEAFVSLVKTLPVGETATINVLFSGTKENGVSWCPPCNAVDPVIKKAVKENAPEDSHFIVVEVGDRPYWKDPDCPFRTDKDILINVIPHLIRWGTNQRLNGDQLLNEEVLAKFFK